VTDAVFAKPPRLAMLEDPPGDDDGDPIECVDGWIEITEQTLDNRVISDPEAEVIEFTGALLRGCRVIVPRTTTIRASRTTFVNCDLSQVPFKTVEHCRFVGCKMTGSSFGFELRDCEFSECTLKVASLASCLVERVMFANCELSDVDAQTARLGDIDFPETRLSDVSMHRTTCERIDLRSAAALGFTNVSTLAGCRVSNHQLYELAPLLAAVVGLDVAE